MRIRFHDKPSDWTPISTHDARCDRRSGPPARPQKITLEQMNRDARTFWGAAKREPDEFDTLTKDADAMPLDPFARLAWMNKCAKAFWGRKENKA